MFESRDDLPENAISGSTSRSISPGRVPCNKASALAMFACCSPILGASWRHAIRISAAARLCGHYDSLLFWPAQHRIRVLVFLISKHCCCRCVKSLVPRVPCFHVTFSTSASSREATNEKQATSIASVSLVHASLARSDFMNALSVCVIQRSHQVADAEAFRRRCSACRT